jgi:membrane protease subunit HflK
VEDLLATSRTLPNGKVENIKDKVQERLLDFLEEVDLGIQVQSVNLIDLQPPLATMEAFRKVNEASETGRAEVLKAKSYAESVVLAAQGNAYRIVDEAKSYRTRIVESVKADSAYFETVLAEYRKNPETMLTALYTDALRTALAQAPNKYIIHTLPGDNQEIRLQIGQIPEKNEGAAAPVEE